MSEPNYYQTVSAIGKPIIESLGVEIRSSCIETIRFLEAEDREMEAIAWTFNVISAIKYLWRLGLKTSDIRSDLGKAIQYLEWELEEYEGLASIGHHAKLKTAFVECQRLLKSAPESSKTRWQRLQLIKDPYFRVEIDLNASSPNPAHAIWSAQHSCVCEGFALDSPIPEDPAAAIIKHQFKPRHWGVLGAAFIKMDFGGFPHDTVMQLVRHQDSKPLVQSMRYTGKRMLEAVDLKGEEAFEMMEKLFYCQPAGEYTTRTGKYIITENQRRSYLVRCHKSCQDYAQAIEFGHPEESARRELKSGYRQNFEMSGTVQAFFHWLDQRTLADSQIEAQTLAWMALEKLEAWEPGLFGWYRTNRAGKNSLSP
jgi:thymidylate synthase (FAD)